MGTYVEALYRKLDRVECVLPNWLRQHERFGGLYIDASGSALRLILAQGTDDAAALKDFFSSWKFTRLLDCLHLKYIGEERADFVLLRFDAGSSTSTDCASLGTLGWFFSLDGEPVGISAYHVLCQDGDNTDCIRRHKGPPATVFCGSGSICKPIGPLLDFDRFGPASPRPRLFDLALVQVQRLDMISGFMRPCSDRTDGERDAAPGLGTAEDIDPCCDYRLTGNITRSCSPLRFRGVASCYLQLGRDRFYFTRQLFFGTVDGRDAAALGDSGSVIVNRSANSVVGLASQKLGSMVVANPLFLKPWRAARATQVSPDLILPSVETIPDEN